MSHYITNIKVNKVFHLEHLNIPVSDTEMKHLLITGKNGSGKTVLLNAIVSFLESIFPTHGTGLADYLRDLEFAQNTAERLMSEHEKAHYISEAKHIENHIKGLSKNIYIEFSKSIKTLGQSEWKEDFFFSYYTAKRQPNMVQPSSPAKPDLTYDKVRDIDTTLTNQFLYFLSDLKIQEALARNEELAEDADKIKAWFDSFEKLLSDIYEDTNLKLKFNYKNYSFTICTNGKEFNFNHLSDGYAAIIEIIADLILKMQDPEHSVSGIYDKPGIVLIDEIETHLHLELQQKILPFLTRVFPNIQFIVTTHSPFVLNSLQNAVAYDLENQESIEDLSEYSYESLTTGYFNVETESSYLRMKLDKYKELCKKGTLSDSEKEERDSLFIELKAIPHAVSPKIVGEFKTFNLTERND